jgi:hypothetical protein
MGIARSISFQSLLRSPSFRHSRRGFAATPASMSLAGALSVALAIRVIRVIREQSLSCVIPSCVSHPG